MKVFIGVGHGGSDSGAVGYLIEKDINLDIAKACYNYLIDKGVDVMLSRNEDVDDPLNNKIMRCNNFNPDVAIDIHNNAGNGNGFEIYYSVIGGTGKRLAENIEKKVVAMGQNSRGIKVKLNNDNSDYYGFIRDTICPAVICEGAFIDNAEDYHFIDTKKKRNELGNAYAKGILDTFDINYEDTLNDNISDEKGGYLIKIIADVLNIRSGPGLAYDVVGKINDNGIYTIVDEVHDSDYTWGKLKSGIGWIALEYTVYYG